MSCRTEMYDILLKKGAMHSMLFIYYAVYMWYTLPLTDFSFFKKLTQILESVGIYKLEFKKKKNWFFFQKNTK